MLGIFLYPRRLLVRLERRNPRMGGFLLEEKRQSDQLFLTLYGTTPIISLHPFSSNVIDASPPTPARRVAVDIQHTFPFTRTEALTNTYIQGKYSSRAYFPPRET